MVKTEEIKCRCTVLEKQFINEYMKANKLNSISKALRDLIKKEMEVFNYELK